MSIPWWWRGECCNLLRRLHVARGELGTILLPLRSTERSHSVRGSQDPCPLPSAPVTWIFPDTPIWLPICSIGTARGTRLGTENSAGWAIMKFLGSRIAPFCHQASHPLSRQLPELSLPICKACEQEHSFTALSNPSTRISFFFRVVWIKTILHEIIC